MVGVCVCIEAAFYCDQQLLWRPLNQSMTSCVCILMTGNQAREDRQVPEWRHDGLVMSLACRRRRCLLKCVLHVALCGCAVLGQWAQTGTDVDNIFSFLYFFVFFTRDAMLAWSLAMALCMPVCHKSIFCWKGWTVFITETSFDLSYNVL